MKKLIESGMYSNNRPKRAKAFTAPTKDPGTPDDVFVGASNDKPGFIAIALKGRTAFIKPENALYMAKQLEILASEAKEKELDARKLKIQQKAEQDALLGVYNNNYNANSISFKIYDTAWYNAKT